MMWFTTLGISFMNITNNKGARTLPCGTPLVTNFQSELLSPITTLCFLLVRKSLTQFMIELSKPYVSSLTINDEWHTLSNALAKSSKIRITMLPLSIECFLYFLFVTNHLLIGLKISLIFLCIGY